LLGGKVGEVYPRKGLTLIRSLNTAERAMQLEQARIDALANNLANVNTAGFKQILTRVAETATMQETDTDNPSANSAVRRAPDGIYLYHALDNRPGQINATGRDTDLAVMGNGFFTVDAPGGNAYTRHGSFALDTDKQLVTPDGFPVLGERGPVILDGDNFVIGPDGTVRVDDKVVERLKIVDFADPSRLIHLGNSLLANPKDMEPEILDPGDVALAQGHTEGSNVNPIDTLVAMIAAQRAFEVQSKVMSTEDEMLEKSVNNLPRVGG
jgi:flagellar basal-body rod protein FlgG